MRLRGLVLFCLLFLSLGARAAEPTWYDQSNEALLPANLDKKILIYTDYPAFWWNFAVVEFKTGEIPWGPLRKACERELAGVSELIRTSPCLPFQGPFAALLKDWSRDYVLRHPLPAPTDLQAKYDAGLAKASLPLPPEILSLLRTDPMSALDELQDLTKSRAGFSFENHQGFFYDPATKRVLMPLQVDRKPMDVAGVGAVKDAFTAICKDVDCEIAGYFGPHFSSLENEMQTRRDVDVVSMVGWTILILSCVLFTFLGRGRVFLLFFAMVPAMGFAGLFTYLIFGKIHGLTLAFGPSISGLAIDYGLHGAFAAKDDREIWRANLLGLCTTLCIFVVILFSQLPILRQIAVFSIFGLSFSYLFLYAFKLKAPALFHLKPFSLKFPPSKIMTGLAGVFLLFAALSPFLLKPNLSLQALNFESPATRHVREWLFKAGEWKAPLIQIQPRSQTLGISLQEQKDWADQQHIKSESAARYLPSPELQSRNLASWAPELARHQNAETPIGDFFEPFWRDAREAQVWDLSQANTVPRYLRDLESNGQWLTLWFPSSAEQSDLIRRQYPDAASSIEILMLFSKTLASELLWMIPLALLISAVFLYLYFSSLQRSLFALVPCLTGLGCFTVCLLATGATMSFITIIGLIMMFSFSLDYGIFVVSAFESGESDPDSLWTSIAFAATTNILGFAPLIFAGHPALQHLGQSLFWGSLGALIGTIWGTPFLLTRFKSWQKARA